MAKRKIQKVAKRQANPKKPGTRFTKRIEQGPNKGDTTRFKVGPSGKPYPTAVVRDRGTPSTLRDNPGVKFPKGKKRRT